MSIPNKKINIPYIKGDTVLPEVTVKAVVVGVILSIVFTMSSLYIGLKFARTVAASIPAALLSILIFKAFKKTNILENVIVQTIASAGESIAAMSAFCITSILLSGYWKEFKYLDTMLILGLGGILGVLMSIPLRNIMIVEEKMPYPEGIAVAEVLISGETKSHVTSLLLKGSGISALITLTQCGFRIGSDFVTYGVKSFGTVIGASASLSPLSLGAGYIIGLGSSSIMLVATLVANFIVIPYLGLIYANEISFIDTNQSLVLLQKQYLRYIAVGVMISGSLWSLVAIVPTIKRAIVLGLAGSTRTVLLKQLRTEKDLPTFVFITGIFLISICIGIFFYYMLDEANYSNCRRIMISGFISFAVIIVGFIMSSVASQLVGILGTTSLPASGLCLATIILFSSIISPILLIDGVSTISGLTMTGLTLIFTSVIGSVMVLGGDNMQDLKTGYLIGSTPWKQQLVLVIGIIASVITTPFVLQTMFEAYGIGDILPRPGMNLSKVLSAPQAMLISSVAKGLFSGKVPWSLLNSGIFIAIIVITIDIVLSRYSKRLRLPIMTFAAGFCLPMGISIAFFCGGVLRYIMSKGRNSEDMQENGTMLASGFIAGEAIMGAFLSIPFAFYKDSNILALPIKIGDSIQDLLGIFIFIVSIVLFLKISRAKKRVLPLQQV